MGSFRFISFHFISFHILFYLFSFLILALLIWHFFFTPFDLFFIVPCFSRNGGYIGVVIRYTSWWNGRCLNDRRWKWYATKKSCHTVQTRRELIVIYSIKWYFCLFEFWLIGPRMTLNSSKEREAHTQRERVKERERRRERVCVWVVCVCVSFLPFRITKNETRETEAKSRKPFCYMR